MPVVTIAYNPEREFLASEKNTTGILLLRGLKTGISFLKAF